MLKKVAALYVLRDGPYFGIEGIEPWDEGRDARLYVGPYKVIAHPPCARWGRYWSGGPSAKEKKLLGNDGGCFAHALWAVRTFGGVLEHPEASHAWRYYGLTKPPKSGGWIKADEYGGLTCCVEQGHYGHLARKATWLYAVNCFNLRFKWGPAPKVLRLDEGFHSKEERARAIKTGVGKRLSKRQREETPLAFRDILIRLVRG